MLPQADEVLHHISHRETAPCLAAGGLIGLALGAGFYEGAFIATAFSKLLWLNDGAPES